MNISKQHIPVGNKRRGYKINPTRITIHSTGNPRSTAQNERDYLTNPNNTNATGYHYAVGDNVIIEIAPPNERMYHAGHSVGNNTSIGIEMIETGNRQEVIQNTLALVKHLQEQFNISNNNVVRHYDWTRKNCPRILNYNNWQGWWEFKKLLGSSSGGDSISSLNEETLSINDRGTQVKELQGSLVTLGYKIDVDGIFGKETKKAVEDFQSKNILVVDGVVGKKTKTKIVEVLSMKPSDWAKRVWEEATKAGDVDGTRPKDTATREEVIAMIYKVLNK